MLRNILFGLFLLSGCTSVDVVRLQPDQLRTPKGMEPLAGIRATCLGFYLFTLGLPEADLDRAINELLMKEAKKIGADQVINLRFDATPSHGIWWLTKLFWFRSATAWGIAIRTEPGGEDEGGAPPLDSPLPAPNNGASPPAPSSSTGKGRGGGELKPSPPSPDK